MREFGFAVPDLNEAIFLQEKRIIRMGVPPLRLEIHTGISGVRFAECYERRVEVIWESVPVSLIALADLKANKLASGRKDEVDLEHLP